MFFFISVPRYCYLKNWLSEIQIFTCHLIKTKLLNIRDNERESEPKYKEKYKHKLQLQWPDCYDKQVPIFVFTTPEYSYVLYYLFPVGHTFIMHHLSLQENLDLLELPLSIILHEEVIRCILSCQAPEVFLLETIYCSYHDIVVVM